MTVKEIIERAMQTKPSQYPVEDMLTWFNDLEGRIWDEVVQTHEGGPESWEPYTRETWEVQPLAAGTYEGMYANWLYAMIDYHNSEEKRYNNHRIMHDEMMRLFRAWYNQKHMPKAGPQLHNYRGW